MTDKRILSRNELTNETCPVCGKKLRWDRELDIEQSCDDDLEHETYSPEQKEAHDRARLFNFCLRAFCCGKIHFAEMVQMQVTTQDDDTV